MWVNSQPAGWGSLEPARKGPPVLARYRIRVERGSTERWLPYSRVWSDHRWRDPIRGDLDQAALHGLLERVRMLRLELVEARRVPGRGEETSFHRPRVIPAGAGFDILAPDCSGRKGVAVGNRTYEIRVAGALGPAGRKAFSDVSIEIEHRAPSSPPTSPRADSMLYWTGGISVWNSSTSNRCPGNPDPDLNLATIPVGVRARLLASALGAAVAVTPPRGDPVSLGVGR